MNYLEAAVSIAIPSILCLTIIKCIKMYQDYDREYQVGIQTSIDRCMEREIKTPKTMMPISDPGEIKT